MENLTSTEFLSNNVFLMGEFVVDCQRGIVSFDNETQAIEPKVMMVLVHLVANAGNVVDQEVLFEKVWPHSIYSPGSVRRCINVLRKVFNDDDKSLIATHPKRGYSLNAQINLQAHCQQPAKQMFSKTVIGVFVAIVCLVTLSILLLSTQTPVIKSVNVAGALPITATEMLEDFAQVSPDGKYIAFVRSHQSDHKKGHVWIKNLSSGEETKLSSKAVYARNIQWHADSKALIYVSVMKNGLEVVRLSLNSPFGESNALVVFKKPDLHWISNLAWTPDNHLYYIARKAGSKYLYSNNLVTGQQNELLASSQDFKLLDLVLSPDGKQLALIGWNASKHSQVKVISMNNLQRGVIDYSHDIELDKNSYDFSWHPNQTSLLLNDGRQLYLLSLSGEFERIDYENFRFIRFAHFSPNGKTISIVLEKLDLDIWLSTANTPAKNKLAFDSNAMERAGTFSPKGDKFAFISESKGYPQIYVHQIATGENRLVFKNLKQNLYISPPTWSPDQVKLAFAINAEPVIIDLTELGNGEHIIDKEYESIQGTPVQWFANKNALLLLSFEDITPQFSQFDLDTKKVTFMANKQHKGVFLDEKDDLYLITQHAILKKTQANETVNVHDFDGDILRYYRTNDGVYIYEAFNDSFNLWLYAFDNQLVTLVNSWPNDQHIMDISNHANMMLKATKTIEKDIIFLSIE